MKAIENGVMSLYDAVIRWILTRVVISGRQFGADFLRQDVNDRGWSHAVHGGCQQMVLFLTPILLGTLDLDKGSCSQGEGRVAGPWRMSY